MIENALKYLIGLKKPETITVDGKPYFDPNYQPAKYPYADTLKINNLTGMVDFIKSNIDALDKDKIFIHVVDYNRVDLLSHVTGFFHERIPYVRSVARETDFQFGKKYGVEDFIIGLHSQFVKSEDRNYLLHVVSSLNVEASKTMKDSGIAQEVTVRKGASSMMTTEKIRNPVTLSPFRTFGEVEQPESEFVFRLHETDGLPYCSLHECDGKFWKQDAISAIGEFFEVNLDISVIA